MLEVGCGTGCIACSLARSRGRMVTTDVSPEAVACARETFAALGLDELVAVECDCVGFG